MVSDHVRADGGSLPTSGHRSADDDPVGDLDRLEADLDDVEMAMACLARESSELCEICRDAREDGSIDSRPALIACATGRRGQS